MTLEREGVMLTGSKSFKGKLEEDENKLLSKKHKHLKLSKLEIENQRVFFLSRFQASFHP